MKSHTLTPAGTVNGHTLTINELATHEHIQSVPFSSSGGKREWSDRKVVGGSSTSSNKWFDMTVTHCGNGYNLSSYGAGNNKAHGHGFTGTQQTINHMNPYSVAYCFRRLS